MQKGGYSYIIPIGSFLKIASKQSGAVERVWQLRIDIGRPCSSSGQPLSCTVKSKFIHHHHTHAIVPYLISSKTCPIFLHLHLHSNRCRSFIIAILTQDERVSSRQQPGC